MLSQIRKKKKIDSHKLQSLQDVVKQGGDTVIKDFKDKFQEVIMEGKRIKTTFVHYTDLTPDNHLPEGE